MSMNIFSLIWLNSIPDVTGKEMWNFFNFRIWNFFAQCTIHQEMNISTICKTIVINFKRTQFSLFLDVKVSEIFVLILLFSADGDTTLFSLFYNVHCYVYFSWLFSPWDLKYKLLLTTGVVCHRCLVLTLCLPLLLIKGMKISTIIFHILTVPLFSGLAYEEYLEMIRYGTCTNLRNITIR